MKGKHKVIIGISATLTVLILLLIGGIWLKLRYNSDFEAIYPEQHLTFTGDFIDYNSFEYKGLSASLAEYKEYDSNGKREKNPIKKVNTNCPLILHINGKSFKVVNIKPTDIEKLGAEFDDPTQRGVIWGSIRSVGGYNPPYSLHCGFFNNQIFALNFNIVNPPDSAMESPKPCPISFSFGKAENVKFPISEKQMKEYLGSPAKVYRHLKWP